jgi:hypothetical protein
MPFQNEKYEADRSSSVDRFSPKKLAIALGVIGIAVAGGIAIIGASRRQRSLNAQQTDLRVADEQAITVKASLETAEAAWVEWCATGHANLESSYAVRFEPAPGARGTEVHLAGGGSTGAIREELRRFKQRLETGKIAMSDSPGLSRPARPRDSAEVKTLAEVLR